MLPTITVAGGSIEIDPQLRAKAWLNRSENLEIDVVQSIIPLIGISGRVYGWLPVTAHTFAAGTAVLNTTTGVYETTLLIEGSARTLDVVTLPYLASTGLPDTATALSQDLTILDPDANDNYRNRVLPHTRGDGESRRRIQQYVALVMNEVEERAAKALSSSLQAQASGNYVLAKASDTTPVVNIPQYFSTLIPVRTNKDIGYYSLWAAPVMYIIQQFSRGPYVFAMINNLDITIPGQPSVTPPGSNATVEWTGNLDPNANLECEYFDYNWIQLFQTSPYVQDGVNVGKVVPLKISLVSQTPTTDNPFLVKVLQSQGPVTYPGGATGYDTIRVICQEQPAAGTYVFNFVIEYAYAIEGATTQSVPATLTLNVAAPT